MIPAEAVEAAAKKLYQSDGLNLWDKEDDSTRAHYTRKARAALEAAAPHIAAGVFDEGVDVGRKYPTDAKARNPYRKAAL